MDFIIRNPLTELLTVDMIIVGRGHDPAGHL